MNINLARAPQRYDEQDQNELRRQIDLYLRTLPGVPEVQSYTPTVTSSGGGETLTYTTQTGRWSRTGRLVWFTAEITLATKSGGSGDIQISLPAPAVAGVTPALAGYVNTMAAGWTGTPLATATAGTSLVRLRELVAGASTAAWTKLGATGGIRVTGTYLAA